jgi:hypothetical protein
MIRNFFNRVINPYHDRGLDVWIQDQTSELIDLYMIDLEDAITPSITASSNIDGYSIEVDNITGILTDDSHAINISENGRTFQSIVKNAVGNTVTFNAPLDMDITTGASVQIAKWNMNTNGSVTPMHFCICPPAGVTWDIVRIIGSIEDNAEMDSSTFGGLSSLSNGLVLRITNSMSKNIFIVQDNGGFAERVFNTKYDDRRSPTRVYGFSYRRTFGRQNKNGVVVRLHGDTQDKLEIINQDNLTELSKLAHVCQGHVVQ